MSKDYVLGVDQIELDRLKLQHDLWESEFINLFSSVEFSKIEKTLELGCGPGYTTETFSKMTQGRVHITATDLSDKFLNYLDSKKIKNVKTQKANILDLDLSDKSYDLAYCRWLMIFVPDINKAVHNVYKHLKPGSQFLMQEYISYDSFDVYPETPHMKTIIEAIFRSWHDQGGHPNQGKYLPEVLEKNNFKIIDIKPIARVATPTDSLWQWPNTFWESFLPRLVVGGYISEVVRSEFMNHWSSLDKKKGALCVAPTVVNIIAEKN